MKSLGIGDVWMCVALAASPVVVDMQGKADSVANNVGKDKWTLVMVWSTACHLCQKETPAISADSGHKQQAQAAFAY